MKLLFSIVTLWFVLDVNGHGMLMEPVSRGSRWRVDRRAPTNYDDNQLFCGGFYIQHHVNDGRCGLCGDNYADNTPRMHEFGGLYGLGDVVALYNAGSVIRIGVMITANHLGHFLFDLCNLDKFSRESDACFAENRLKLSNGASQFIVSSSRVGWFNTTLQLPTNIKCRRCVLRWTYITGNSWGVCDNGSGQLGCGPQENFRGCSDIGIRISRYSVNRYNFNLPPGRSNSSTESMAQVGPFARKLFAPVPLQQAYDDVPPPPTSDMDYYLRNLQFRERETL